MKSKVWAVPKKGLLVRNPFTRQITSEEGGWVDWTGNQGKHWRKLERQGDIEVFDSPPEVKKVSSEIKKVLKVK